MQKTFNSTRYRAIVHILISLFFISCSNISGVDKSLKIGSRISGQERLAIGISAVGNISSNPIVDVDKILQRTGRPLVSDVGWYDDGNLIGLFRDPGTEKVAARTISLDGQVRNAIAEGENITLSPDGRTSILYTEGGWLLLDLGTGERYEVGIKTDDNRKFIPHYDAPVWSGDSRYVAFVENHRPENKNVNQKEIINSGVKIIDMGVSEAPLARWSSRVTVIDTSNPSTVQRYQRNESMLNMAWNGENNLFVSAVQYFSDEASTKILKIDVVARKSEIIYSTAGRFQSMEPAIQPAGNLIALILNVDTRIWEEFQSIILVDSETGEEIRRLTDDLPVLKAIWAPNGKELYALVRGGGLDQIYVVPLEGRPRQLTDGPRRHFGMSLSRDGRKLAYQTLDGYGRKDIRIFDLETEEESVVLVIDDPAKEFNLGKWQHVSWQSTDDVSPYGYVILPPDFDPDLRYPMIVDIHGGGPGSRLYLFGPLTAGVAMSPLEWHAWAAMGYVVFVPDYRSSGDYGARPIVDIYNSGRMAANKDIDDIVTGTRFMLDQGFIDRKRIALLGHSAGGKRGYVILNNYDIFAAAILNEAIAPDVTSALIELSSGRNSGGYPASVFRQFLGGDLSKVPERYKENHMFDSYGNKTPTLIMVGNEELGGVGHMPNEVMYSILKENGVPTRMLKFVDEGHVYSRPESAKLAFEEVRKWLEAHMPAE